MNRALILSTIFPLALSACSAGDAKTKDQTATGPRYDVTAATAVERPIARFIRATGTLMAEEQAEVAAETAGRVVSAPIERGTPVVRDTELIRVSPTETDAALQEAQANAAQIEARLGLTAQDRFDVNRVPEVQNAKAAYDLAESEFNRIKPLLDQRVVAPSEFDQRRTQMEATRQQLEASKNTALQQYQSLLAARARVVMARKAFTDTVVRAPFTGVVAQRLVTAGDYVTKGMKVAVVVRVNPLRVQLTVPQQFVSAVGIGLPVNFEVDAYPGRTFAGTIRYVSPALQADQRALTVEAVVDNPKGELKPGLFATARVEQPVKTPGVLVPPGAVQTSAGTSRLFVINGDRVEERIVTTGETVGDLVEISKGLKAGEVVAATEAGRLTDGARVTVRH